MDGQRYDLTEGVIWKKLLYFFLPIFAGNLLQQLYISADAVIIGQCAGKDALASIDAMYNLIKLPVNFFTGLSAGAAIIIAHYCGAKDTERLSQAVHTAMAFAFSGGLTLSAAGEVFLPWGLSLLRIPGEIYPSALSYARIYFAGMALSMTYNIGAGILRAAGNSKTPFYILIAANLANVVFDLIFVGVFRWHTGGAALATVLSQLLSAVLVVTALMRTSLPCRLTLKKIRFHNQTLRKIFSLGLPLAVQSSLYPIANMMIQSKINTFGVNSIAAWAVCGKLDFLIWLVVDSLGSALATFTAQNFGAGLNKRARSGVRVSMGISLLIVGVISAVLYLFCGSLGKIFLPDAAVIEVSVNIMRFLAPFYVFYIGGELLSGAICGTGETVRPMLLTAVGICASRILWVLFIVPLRPTLRVVIGTFPVSWMVTSLIFTVFYQIHKRKKLPL